MQSTQGASLYDLLSAVGRMADVDISVSQIAVYLAAAEMPGISLDRYFFYLSALGPRVRQRHSDLIAAGADDHAATELAALKHILADEDGFEGDRETYDLLDNANLIRVIDRRRGMPIALAVLYLQAGQSAGFDVQGINFPGHFLLRLQKGGQTLLFDPFDRCAVLAAPDLRRLLKRIAGPEAELSAHFYQPVGPRDILIRLQNNIKSRQIELEDYASALRTVERMRLIDPREFRLLLDAGVLYAKLGAPHEAIPMLDDYIHKLPIGDLNRADAVALRHDLIAQLGASPDRI